MLVVTTVVAMVEPMVELMAPQLALEVVVWLVPKAAEKMDLNVAAMRVENLAVKLAA